MFGKRKNHILILFCAACCLPFQFVLSDERETVLDKKVYLEPKIIKEIPYVPPLCDSMKGRKNRIEVGGCKLYCEIEGQGESLVLLHGGPGATHHYFHPHFTRAAEFAHVIYYDQRGCGLSDYKPAKGYTVHQAVEDLDKLRKSLKLEKWMLLGHSYGGFLAQCYALTHPERVKGLVLVCASTGMDASFGSRQYDYLSKQERIRIKEIYRDYSLTTAQRVFNGHLNGDWKRQSFYKPNKVALIRTALYEWVHDPEFRPAMGSSIQEFNDMTGLFKKCPIPTLIMEAKWDLTWGKDKASLFHKNHPSAKMVMYERSGHNPFEDEPDRFFKELKGFMKSVPNINEKKLLAWTDHCRKKIGLNQVTLSSKISDGEKKIIDTFNKQLKKVGKGQRFMDQSTPAGAYVTMVYAIKKNDISLYWESNPTHAVSVGLKGSLADLRYLGSLEICRIDMNVKNEEGAICPIYIGQNGEPCDIQVFAFHGNKWRKLFNTGGKINDSWRKTTAKYLSLMKDLAVPPSKAQAKELVDFNKMLEKAYSGVKYKDQSTPAGAYITLISASKNRDLDFYRQVNPSHWNSLKRRNKKPFLSGGNPRAKIYYIGPILETEVGSICHLYTGRGGYARNIEVLGLYKGKWRKLFNTGYLDVDWRDSVPKYYKEMTEFLGQ